MTFRRVVLAPLLLLAFTAAVSNQLIAARESNGTPAAKRLFDQAERAAKAGNAGAAIATFRRAIDTDPDFVDAHQRLIDLTQREDVQSNSTEHTDRLRQQYERWVRAYPKRAVYAWALGVLTSDLDRADALLRQALVVDPAFARAHVQLAKNADQRGDWSAQCEQLKAAVDGNPGEPRYLVRYAVAEKRRDTARFRELALQVVRKFPGTQSAAEALYELASESADPGRRGYFDRLRAEYPVDRFNYAAVAMNDLYADLAPADALVLAREMSRALPAMKMWALRVTALEALTHAQALVAAGRFDEASDVLAHASPPSGNHGVTWTLLKAEAAAGAGHPDQAYSALIASVAATPEDRIDAALARYGSAIGRTRADVDADVWRARDAKATPAAPFEFASLRDGTPVRLADYRGRVVLVAFWYPT